MNSINLTISIIIPTYNRISELTDCLSALSKQNYDGSLWEIIVVNDGGIALEEVVAQFSDRLMIKLINQENQGPAQARNRGAIESLANFLVFIDDDCFVCEDWLQQIFRQCQENPQSIIGGQTLNALPENIYSTTSQAIVDVAYQYYNFHAEKAQFFASNNMIIPRLQFLELGGFHPDFRTSEDREFCDRWLRKGYGMIYDRDIKLTHAHKLNFFSFWQQHFSYGKGAFNFHQIRFIRGASPFRPDLSFHRKLVIYPFQYLRVDRALIVAILMFISQLATTIGYLIEKQKYPDRIATLDQKLAPLTCKG